MPEKLQTLLSHFASYSTTDLHSTSMAWVMVRPRSLCLSLSIYICICRYTCTYAYTCIYVYEQPHSFTEEKSRLWGSAFWCPEVALSGKQDRNGKSDEINTHDNFLSVQACIGLNEMTKKSCRSQVTYVHRISPAPG